MQLTYSIQDMYRYIHRVLNLLVDFSHQPNKYVFLKLELDNYTFNCITDQFGYFKNYAKQLNVLDNIISLSLSYY